MITTSQEDQKLLKELNRFSEFFQGDVFTDDTNRILYATDASAYREIPLAVVRPKNVTDIKKIIRFAAKYQISLIPRTAGTSLAGQVVGYGIVVDVSKYMTRIIEINEEEKWVKVEPGVILDELNKILLTKGLFFGPETSTANRCMIGGMVGNNSCGLHSLVYGSARDHTLEIKAILSDGSEAHFNAIDKDEFEQKCQGDQLENKLYLQLKNILLDEENQKDIRREFPHPEIERRNTGYALDLLLDSAPFTQTEKKFNFCDLLAGSEGTLAFYTEIKLNLVPAPPTNKALVCVHLNSVIDATKANLIALQHQPSAIELMDKAILNLTKENRAAQKNRFFLKGDPGAILIVEFNEKETKTIEAKTTAMESEMRKAGLGYHFPIVTGADIKKVWDLRKAGLGVLSNLPGDAKPVSVIEDTAVCPADLPAYIEEFNKILDKHKLKCVYHAHIATGELHLRPILNLKDPKDVELFHTIAKESAELVKKYRGSLSGEHGDGRLRGEFIPLMLGNRINNIFKDIKECWDPEHIFNPGKITDTPKMNAQLRYEPGKETREFETIFDFSKEMGLLRATEKCNGSGDCRKSEIIGGTMCPSYMALKDESTTTRARANILREFLTNSDQKNPFDHKEVYDVLDLCLSCKGCKSECPSSVDMAKLKAEFLQHYYDSNGISLRTRAIAYITSINKLGMLIPSITNFVMSNPVLSSILKKVLGFAPKRSIPLLYKITLRNWAKKNLSQLNPNGKCKGQLNLFVDEFTDYNDVEIGITAIKLLTKLGYEVSVPKHTLSGRTFLSKGLLRKAKKIANKNIELLKNEVSLVKPLVGIEPSGILTFRDEYPDLANPENKESAKSLANSTFLFEEFIAEEIEKGHITHDQFTDSPLKIKLHGHCQQKALVGTGSSKTMLSLPVNYNVDEIPSGCCGMAGSFGYEEEHYNLSMKVGELVLFPEVRKASTEYLISAPGTSCRHQIKDGTGKEAKHPLVILYEALK